MFLGRRWLLTWLAVVWLSSAARAADPIAPVNISDCKPPIRTACIGDSITQGVGADGGWAWPDQLDRMLDGTWDVRNYGKSYSQALKSARRPYWGWPEFTKSKALCADAVIIMLGTNDGEAVHEGAKAEFQRDYKALVLEYRKLPSKPRVFCCTPPWAVKREALYAEIIATIQQVAKELDCDVIDLTTPLRGKKELLPDGLHPNTAGATVIATTIYKALTGKAWEGKVPGPQDVVKPKPTVRFVENPGEFTYRETFALIVTEAGLPADKLATLRDRFEETVFAVEAKICELEGRIEEYDQLRMKYKHTKIEADKRLYGLYKGKAAETKKELLRYKNAMNMVLIALVPDEYKAAFGAGWVRKYVYDRLAPVTATITSAQRKQIRDISQAAGPAYGRITNTPERSIESVEVYGVVYEKVLDGEQKKRVMPQ